MKIKPSLLYVFPIFSKDRFRVDNLSIEKSRFLVSNKRFELQVRIMGKTDPEMQSQIMLKTNPLYEISHIHVKPCEKEVEEVHLKINISCKKDDEPFYELPLGYFYENSTRLKTSSILCHY